MTFHPNLVHGNKDLIEILEDALNEARAGNFEAVVIVGVTKGDGKTTGAFGWKGALNDDMLFAHPRLVAALHFCLHELATQDLNTWK